MSVAIIRGSSRLIGSEAILHFAEAGLDVVGVDNDIRRVYFGDEGSTAWKVSRLERALGAAYRHVGADIRDRDGLSKLFARYSRRIEPVNPHRRPAPLRLGSQAKLGLS